MDASGSHVVATIQAGGSAESFYVHAKWKKPRALAKLKSVPVTCLAWSALPAAEASTGRALPVLSEHLLANTSKLSAYITSGFLTL